MKEGMSAALLRVYPRTWIKTIEERKGEEWWREERLAAGWQKDILPSPSPCHACMPYAASRRLEGGN